MLSDEQKKYVRDRVEQSDGYFWHADRNFGLSFESKPEAEYAMEYYLSEYPRAGYGTSVEMNEMTGAYNVQFYRYHSCD